MNTRNPIQRRSTGTPLATSLRERLDKACETFSSATVREESGLSGDAFFRAKAGEKVHGGTAVSIERALDRLEAP